jgi:hypothetical protein
MTLTTEAEASLSTNVGYQDWELEPSYRDLDRDRDRERDRDRDRDRERERDRERDRERERDRDRDREVGPGRVGAEDQPRLRVKPQLSWEQYSQGDPSDDLKYVVADSGFSKTTFYFSVLK